MTRLTTPVRLGPLTLEHRLVMCPLTRNRASEAHNVGDLHVTYYGERATKGGLLITEATYISERAGG
jgi:2,4-dienoyl-CoA reductase-like NADH-dependent reductase (Old Yellow Enzyme family)